jgi:hypothetical protein
MFLISCQLVIRHLFRRATAVRCLASKSISRSECPFRATDTIPNIRTPLTVMSASVRLLARSVSIQVPIGSILVKSFHCQNSSSVTEESHEQISGYLVSRPRCELSTSLVQKWGARTHTDLGGKTVNKLWLSLLQRTLDFLSKLKTKLRGFSP